MLDTRLGLEPQRQTRPADGRRAVAQGLCPQDAEGGPWWPPQLSPGGLAGAQAGWEALSSSLGLAGKTLLCPLSAQGPRSAESRKCRGLQARPSQSQGGRSTGEAALWSKKATLRDVAAQSRFGVLLHLSDMVFTQLPPAFPDS